MNNRTRCEQQASGDDREPGRDADGGEASHFVSACFGALKV
jgi:hypothetical protein